MIQCWKETSLNRLHFSFFSSSTTIKENSGYHRTRGINQAKRRSKDQDQNHCVARKIRKINFRLIRGIIDAVMAPDIPNNYVSYTVINYNVLIKPRVDQFLGTSAFRHQYLIISVLALPQTLSLTPNNIISLQTIHQQALTDLETINLTRRFIRIHGSVCCSCFWV